jgi:hypothetical protein
VFSEGGDILHTGSSFSPVFESTDLGFIASVMLYEGLNKTIEWRRHVTPA